MAYEPLHHKYRPQIFADLVGQDAIATTLTNAIESQRIVPAYLFTGPRGTGKTSSARILAKSLNCLSSDQPTPSPCGTCTVCQEITKGISLDVIEIDAASNTGVDNIRELIERSQFSPVQCRFKIYCLDEVHMLSTAAFNALLKTLEEPPDRVVFILATTDPQRVLPTVISRCQRFDFRRIALDAMVQHLTYIAKQETIAVTPTAVELIAQVAQGGLRDAESLLDQLSLLAGEVDNIQVWDLVGSVPEQALLELLQAIVQQQPALMVERTQALLNRGREPLIVLQNLAGFFRDLLIAKTAPERRDLVAITEATWVDLCQVAQQFEVEEILAKQQHLRSCEAQIKTSTQPRLWLEVSLLGLLSGATASPAPIPVQRQPVQSLSEPVAVLETPATNILDPRVTAATSPVSTVSSADTPVVEVSESSDPETTDDAFNLEPELALTRTVEPEMRHPSVDRETTRDQNIDSSAATPQEGIESSVDLQPDQGKPAIPEISKVQNQPFSSPPPSPLPPEASTAQPSPPQIDLADAWQQLLQNLNLPSRALLKEHGQLLYWQGREVRIGIRKTLLRLAQSKISELEETFEKCFDSKVKVTLKVLTEEQMHPQPLPSKSPIPSRPTPIVSPASPPAPPPMTSGEQAVASPPLREVVAPSPPTPPSWQGEDEMTSAARSFAQFFNGAFVDTDPKGIEKAESAQSETD